MPLPLILVGAAVVAGVYGIKKGVDAASDYGEAKDVDEEARRIYNDAENALDRARERAQGRLEALGRRKEHLYNNGLIPFVKAYERIKHVNLRQLNVRDDLSVRDLETEMLDLEKVALQMEEALGGGAAALGSGALTGMAAYGSVGVLGTASTGTAISGLSGAAATNATLAWLGGGSLASGGLGIAGGTAVLGGIVAAPVLLVGGLVLAAKAEAAIENARSNRAKARLAAEAMLTAVTAARAITAKAAESDRVLQDLQGLFVDDLDFLQNLVDRETDFRRYERSDRERLCRVASTAVTIKNLMNTPLLDEDGAITKKIRQALRNTKDYMEKLNATGLPSGQTAATRQLTPT